MAAGRARGLGSRQVTWPFPRGLRRGQGLCHTGASVLHFVISGRRASVRTGAAGAGCPDRPIQRLLQKPQQDGPSVRLTGWRQDAQGGSRDLKQQSRRGRRCLSDTVNGGATGQTGKRGGGGGFPSGGGQAGRAEERGHGNGERAGPRGKDRSRHQSQGLPSAGTGSARLGP